VQNVTHFSEFLMRILSTITAAAAIAALSTTATAGGLSPEVMEAPVAVAPAAAPAGSSINPAFVVVGVLAALLIAANSSSSSDNSGPSDQEGPDSPIVIPIEPEQPV
jgi:hypothetical protein